MTAGINCKLVTKRLQKHLNNSPDFLHSIASATLFPAGWVLKERIGWRVTELHHPVPQWDNKLSASVAK